MRSVGLLAGGVVLLMCVVFVAATTSGAPSSSMTATPSATSYAMAMYDQKRTEGAGEAQQSFDIALSRYEAGQGSLEDVIAWSDRTRDAHYAPNGAADHRDRLLKVEKAVQRRVAAGTATSLDAHTIAYHRALAEASAP